MSSEPQTTPPAFCADVSRGVNEPMHGTGLATKAWIAIEYSGEWRSHPDTDNDLPAQVQGWLSEALPRFEDPRLLFIKQDRKRKTEDVLDVFISLAGGPSPRMAHYEVEAHEDLLSIDLDDLLSGGPVAQLEQVSDPTLLICTNGKRDACCARDGSKAYTAHAEVAGRAVWQSTHIGGHRFSATAALLPWGVFVGRLDLVPAADFWADLAAGQVKPLVYRGRSSWPQPVQIAEFYLGQHRGTIDLNNTAFTGLNAEDKDHWTASFEVSGQPYAVTVDRSWTDTYVYKNSGKDEQIRVPAYEWRVE